MKLIIATTYRQAEIIARREQTPRNEWRFCPDVHSLEGYGPENDFVQCEPVLAPYGSKSSIRFFEALERIRVLEARGAKIRSETT